MECLWLSLETVSTRCWLQCHLAKKLLLVLYLGLLFERFQTNVKHQTLHVWATNDVHLFDLGQKWKALNLNGIPLLYCCFRLIFPEKPHISLSVPWLWNDVSLVEVIQQWRALHLTNKVIFLLYFGFWTRDLPGMSCITLCVPWL
jgi:hypothetical protein